MTRSSLSFLIIFIFSQTTFAQDFNPPQNFTGNSYNDSTFLSWDAPQSRTLSHYNIYYKGLNNGVSVYLDSTSETEYKFPNRSFAYITIYEVAAVYTNPDGISEKVSLTLSCPALWEAPLEIDFEDTSEIACGISSSPLLGQTDWDLSKTEYFSENKSAFYFSDTTEHQSLLFTTMIDQESIWKAYLSFYYKAPQIEGTSDTLYVYYSENMLSGNFPEDWTLIAGPYMNAEDWTYIEISLEEYPKYLHLGFQAISGSGNGVYLDDLKIFEEPGDVEEISGKNKIAKIYPMPASDELFLDFTQNFSKSEIFIYNISGKHLIHQKVQNKIKHAIDVSNLAEGMYFIKVISDQHIEISKLIINR